MSLEAMTGAWRLEIHPPIDPTAMLCLVNICWRYNEKDGYARPGINLIASDTGFKRRTIIAALSRLSKAGLISRERGIGRGKTTRYRLPWLRLYLGYRSSDGPIIWNRDKRGEKSPEKVHPNALFQPEKGAPQCTLSGRKGAAERHKGCSSASERVRHGAPERKKEIKCGQDQVAQPIPDSERHEISTACFNTGIRTWNLVDIKMKADDLGYATLNDDLIAIRDLIQSLQKEKSQGATP